MQDRFKFRIWDGAEMHYNDFVVTATGYAGKITEEFLGNCVFNQEDLTADKECILMQCIGLKDKKGKIIYEGDILKDKYGALHPISWNFKGFYEADTFAIAGFYNTIQEDMEVIGNIYENPELLEVEK